MTHLLVRPRAFILTILTVGVLAFVGCGGDPTPITSASSNYEVDDGEGSATASPTLDGDRNSIPDAGGTSTPNLPNTPAGQPGTASIERPATSPPVQPRSGPASDKPEDLLAYVQQLETRQPTGANQEEQLADFLRTRDEIIGICDRLIAMNVPSETKLGAAHSKVDSLSQMLRFGAPEASKRLDEFVATLNASKDEGLQKLGVQIAFGNKMQALRAGEDVDPISVIEDLTHFVTTEPKDRGLLEMGGTVGAILEQAGHAQQASEAFRLIAAAFKDSQEEGLREGSASFLERAHLLDSDITTMLSEMLQGKDEAVPKFVATAQGLLQAQTAGFVTLSFFQQVAPTLEVSKPEVAEQIYAAIDAAFQASPNQDLAKMATQLTSSYKVRSTLVGKPFIVEGTDLNGKKLDWAQYKDKIVLVDFWATESPGSLEGLGNIRANYDRYHEQGFEVVGVNLDSDLRSLERFLSFQKLPWPSVLGVDPTSRNPNPMIEKYGVNSVPFMVLVGKDGNVIAANLRGDMLDKQLAGLFPSTDPLPEEVADPAEAAKPATPNPPPGAPDPAPTAPNPPPAAPNPPPAVPNPAAPSPPVPEPAANDGAQTGSLPRASGHGRGTGFVGIAAPGIPASPQQQPDAVADEPRGAEAEADDQSEVNPYSPASGLSPRQLVDFIFTMQEKPLSIQRRPGFAAAIVEAADQILAAKATDQLQIVAAEAKFEVLHQAASLGDEQADRQLDEFVRQMQEDARERIAKQVRFFNLERKTLGADEMPLEALPELLEELETYFADQKLTQKHLRIASATVHVINRIKDGQMRETHFKTFGTQFAASKDKELARYGRKIGKAPAQPVAELVGKPLELNGVTALGTEFEWKKYRGKVVVVDFWATWCGPCRRETPHLQALAKTSDKLAVVAISLDRDLEAVEKYLDENQIEWANLVGEEATQIASKYGVRAIPTMLVVDAEGNVAAVGNSVAQIRAKVQQLLGG